MLDYIIRVPLAPSISTGFYGWIGQGGSFSRGNDFYRNYQMKIDIYDEEPL
jgi:hypothetical protein